MAKTLYDFDLIVIGSGIGGSVAAQLAAAQGKKTAIVEEAAFGGECSNWGCVPTKTLLNVAHIYDQAKHADRFGLRSSTISYNYPSIRNWKNAVLKNSGLFDAQKTYEKNGIKAITGHAGFVGPHEIIVGQRRYSSANFIIATGSRLVWPDIDGLDRVKYMTHHDAVDLPKAPKSIAIIGGGATGCEFAELFAIFGSKVYIVESQSNILPEEDKEVGETLTTIFERDRNMSVLNNAKVTKVRQTGAKKEVFYQSRSSEQSIKVDEIMVATGKSANVNLGLENAKVKYSDQGIVINAACQTNRDYIYAIGDCTGVAHYTHLANMQAKVAVHNMFSKGQIAQPKGAMPRCLFTSPEVACIGLTSAEARHNHLRTKVALVSSQTVPRAHIDDTNEGFVKLIVDAKNNQLLGASIVAPHATEIVHELSVIMHTRMPIQQLQHIYHAFPTWSELLQVAAQKL